MSFDIEEAAEVLTRTPAVLTTLLDGLAVAWTTCDEGSDTWNAVDVVSHLIHCERTEWIPRVEINLSDREPPTFGSDDGFASTGGHAGQVLSELLGEFALLRADSLRRLAELVTAETDLEVSRPQPNSDPLTLRELLASWVVHDLGHVAQIVRVMARRYDAEVGPWRVHLTILKRAGEPEA